MAEELWASKSSGYKKVQLGTKSPCPYRVGIYSRGRLIVQCFGSQEGYTLFERLGARCIVIDQIKDRGQTFLIHHMHR